MLIEEIVAGYIWNRYHRFNPCSDLEGSCESCSIVQAIVWMDTGKRLNIDDVKLAAAKVAEAAEFLIIKRQGRTMTEIVWAVVQPLPDRRRYHAEIPGRKLTVNEYIGNSVSWFVADTSIRDDNVIAAGKAESVERAKALAEKVARGEPTWTS